MSDELERRPRGWMDRARRRRNRLAQWRDDATAFLAEFMDTAKDAAASLRAIAAALAPLGEELARLNEVAQRLDEQGDDDGRPDEADP